MVYHHSDVSMVPAAGHEPAAQLQQSTNQNISSSSIPSNRLKLPKLLHYKWWLRITTYTISILVGQSAAVLLGRLYFNQGGNSKWMATFVQSSGFPILIPLLFYFRNSNQRTISHHHSIVIISLYIFFGVLLAGNNLMYSYGIMYVPVSTYSLLCGTQLAFNAVFAYFINNQKFTPFILNSLVLLTVSAALLAFQSDDKESLPGVSRAQYVIGFILTLGASAAYSLYLSLLQLSFEKVIGRDTFVNVLDMLFYTGFISTCVCTVGLFASGEWRELSDEMILYRNGEVSYLMTLIWTAVSWQLFTVGLLGLVVEVSSLFSNVIGTLGLPVVPVLAVVFFKDRMDGTKVIALLLAVWGFVSYIYQHYLDDTKSVTTAPATATAATEGGGEAVVELC